MDLNEFMTFGADPIDLSTVQFTPEFLRNLPADTARKYRALPVLEKDGRLHIAVAAFRDLNKFDSLTHLLKRGLEFRAADPRQLDEYIARLYGR